MAADPTPTPAVRDDITPDAAPDQQDAVVEDVLVEEVSIDGMCGVY
ncbi:mycofactocin precursor MftA [uncultured Jatrophihabitans sp.]